MQDGLRFQINLRSSVCGIRRACLLTEMLTVVSRLQETLSVFSSQEKKNPDTFLMRICSWNEKMCLWLVFSFSQDSRFILSVRRSKRNEELSGLLFLRCVLQDSKHILDFFSKRLKPILQIYMLLEMEETLGNIKHFSKGISYAFGVGQYFMVRGHLC